MYLIMYLTLSYAFVPTILSANVLNIELTATDDAYAGASYTGFTQATPMPFPLSDHTGTLIQETLFGDTNGDRIYILGGCNSTQFCVTYNDTEVGQQELNCACTQYTNYCHYYLINQGTWHQCASSPIPRYRHTAVLINNMIYVTGGRNIPYDNIIYQIDVYDPVADSWSTLPSAAENPNFTSDGASFVSGDYWYFLGGYTQDYTSVTTTTRFNTVNSTWSTVTPMEFDRGDVSVLQLGDFYYAVGGWTSSNEFCEPLQLVERYSVEDDTWARAPDMIYARGKPALGTIGKYLFAIAGETKPEGDLTCSRSAPVPYSSRLSEEYESWVIEQTISESVYRFVGVTYPGSASGGGGTAGPSIYLFGGQGPYDPATSSYNLKSTVLQYVPASTQTSSGVNLNGGDIAGIVIGVVVFCVGLAVVLAFCYLYRQRYYTKADYAIDARELQNSAFSATVPALEEDKIY